MLTKGLQTPCNRRWKFEPWSYRLSLHDSETAACDRKLPFIH